MLDHVMIDNATVTIPMEQHISFDTLRIGTGGITNVIFEGDIDRARDIQIGSHGFLVQKNNHTQTISGSLLVENEGTLTHAPNMTSLEFAVKFNANDIRIDPGGIVNLDGLGYAPGQAGPGAGGTSLDGAGGGANGGKGGDGAVGQGGTPYCNADNITPGSGGGNGSPESSGAGGGLSILKAAHTFTLNGVVHANGYDGMTLNAGGGGGGGLAIVATTVTGTPQEISIRGGKGNAQGGGGGGGCVAIKFVMSNSITEDLISKEGGASDKSASISSTSLVSLPVVSTTSDLSNTSSTTTSSVDSNSSGNLAVSDSAGNSNGKPGEEGKVYILQISADSTELPAIPLFMVNNASDLNSVEPGVSGTPSLYYIEQSGSEENNFTVVSSSVLMPTSFTFDNLSTTTFYQFRVRYADAVLATSSNKTSISSSYTWLIPQNDSSPNSTLPDTLKIVITTSTATSTHTIVTTKLPLLKVLFTDSHVAIRNIPSVSEFYPGDLITYSYDFSNSLPDRQRFKVVRQIINEGNGKIILNKESSLTLREHQNFSFAVNERLPLSVKGGVFIARILIINSNGEQIDGNGFRFIIQEK
jgi:hypothetical protein